MMAGYIFIYMGRAFKAFYMGDPSFVECEKSDSGSSAESEEQAGLVLLMQRRISSERHAAARAVGLLLCKSIFGCYFYKCKKRKTRRKEER